MGSPWSGCVVYASFEAEPLREVAIITHAVTMGVTVTKLGASTPWLLDNANTVMVRLSSGQLQSISAIQLLQGGNLACVGDEIVQFKHAILQGDGSYCLSQLVRGRCGTEGAILNHEVEERFVLLTPETLSHWPLNNDAIGQSFTVKAVSLGLSLEESPSEHFYYQANHLRPLAAVHLQGRFNAAKDLCVSWVRRSRISGEWRDNVDVPLSEVQEVYDIEFSSQGDLVRAVTVDKPEFIYTQAMQQIDGWQAGESINVTVYQWSEVIGRGLKASVQFTINY